MVDGSSPPDDSVRALATFLSDYKGPLRARWLHRVLADPAVPVANQLPMPTLQDHIPDLLDRHGLPRE